MKRIISAAVTPFTEDDRLDLDSARRMYEFNLSHGCDGFFVLGTMGEWALLTPEEKLDLATCACDVVGSRADVLVGISDTGFRSILRNMEKLGHLPHAYWTLLLPGGWPGPACPVDYVHRIADAADRPIYFYYAPAFNGITLTTEQFRDILSHPRIVGLKNSSGTIRTRKELLLLKRTVDFDLFEGEEWGIDEALIAGCDGAVVGFASTGVKLMKEIARCVDAGDPDGARESQFALIDIFHKVYGPGAMWWSSGQKYALQYLGIIASARSRVESQQNMPEDFKAGIRACVDAYRDRLV